MTNDKESPGLVPVSGNEVVTGPIPLVQGQEVHTEGIFVSTEGTRIAMIVDTQLSCLGGNGLLG